VLDILFATQSGEMKLKDYNLDQWRLMHIGAQPVPPSLIKEWKKVFPHHQYDTNYGLTECTGPGCVHLGMENMHKVGSIGLPGFDWEIRIVDSTLNPVVQVKPGQELTKEEINDFCQALPRYKRPRRIIFGDVPRNPTGKIEKPKLRKQYAGVSESFKI
jgi:acyl-CoA synthetase (AMP-forming)/AMP-acid ligase II